MTETEESFPGEICSKNGEKDDPPWRENPKWSFTLKIGCFYYPSPKKTVPPVDSQISCIYHPKDSSSVCVLHGKITNLIW